jgi:hypothetical protein
MQGINLISMRILIKSLKSILDCLNFSLYFLNFMDQANILMNLSIEKCIYIVLGTFNQLVSQLINLSLIEF